MATKPKVNRSIPIKRSRVPMTMRILLVQAVTVALVVGAVFFFLPIPGFGWIVFIIIAGISALTNLLLSLVFYYDWKNRTYTIKPEGIVENRGIFGRNEMIYPLNNVESITLNQDMMGRYGSYGTIQLYDPALKQTIYLVNIENPEYYQKLLTKLYILQEEKGESRFVIK